MSRNLTVGALSQIANKTGSEPLIIIEIDWVDGTTIKYCDKELSGISGLILSLSSLDEVIQLSEGMSTAQLSVTLDDTDGHIKALMDQYDLHKRPCRVKQYFDGMAISDAFELFRGEVMSPIVWSEGERTVSFEVVTQIRSYNVGFSPDQGQYSFVQYELAGNVWPTCFGSPVHVPAAKVSQIKTGTLMSMIGIPDATLPLKRDLLRFRLDQIQDAYDKYQELIKAAKAIARPAYEIQDDYASTIVCEDDTKQTIEDQTEAIEKLNLKIDTLIKEYGNAFDDEDREKEVIKDELDSMVQMRDNFIERLKSLNKNARMLAAKKKALETELDNVKYEITVVNKLRKRCRDLQQQWYKFYREWSNVVEIIATQSALGAQATSVMNGTIFPQSNPTLLNIAGVPFSGTFSGYGLALGGVQPSYRNILLAARESDDLQSFWIQDSSIKLAGKYLRLANGRIVKVTQQEGNKCLIDLPPKKKKKRTEKRDVQYDGPSTDPEKFEAVLNRTLTGQESVDQIQNLISAIPTDISQRIWNKLKGPKQTFTIYIDRELASAASYFRLAYGLEEASEKIYLDKTETEMRDIILDSTLSINDITLTIVETHSNGCPKKIEITQPANSGAFTVVDVFAFANDNEPTPGTIIGRYENNTESGYKDYKLKLVKTKFPKLVTHYLIDGQIYIIINGVRIELNYGDDTSLGYFSFDVNNLRQRFVDKGAFDASDTSIDFSGFLAPNWTVPNGVASLLEDELTIRVLNNAHSVFIENQASIRLYRESLGEYFEIFPNENENVGQWPHFEIETDGDLYAFEHTRKARQKIIEDDIEKDVNAPALIAGRDKVRELLKQKREQQLNGQVDIETETDLQSASAHYAKIISKIKQGTVGLEKAYEIISEEEHKQLYEMELTGYLEWRNDLKELDQTFTEEDQYEFTALDINATIPEACPVILPEWVEWINGLDKWKKAFETELLPNNTTAFIGQVGDVVTLEGTFQEKYVANILPSTVHAVYAYRNNAGIKQLTPVPSSYYTKNENESFGLFNCTTITLAQPLSMIDENWEDQIYVTLTSSVGPNITDIIQWIIANYTNLGYDTTSFAEVNSLVSNYPANFAVLQRIDSLQLIREIAFQSRCSVWNKLGKVYIRYLPKEPDAVKSITEDNIEEKSFQLTFTPSEEIVTKLTATWRPHYAIQNPWQIVVRRNLQKYGEYPEDRDFYIYNDRDLVYKSATWWLIMWANTFKHAKFRVFLDQLNLETFDCIELSLSNNPFASENIKGIIRKADYDSESHSIQMEVWLPVLSGQMTKYKFAWPADLVVADNIWPPEEDIVAGNAGNPINQLIPTGTEYDPVNDNDFNLRPQDFGKPDISDVDDNLPQNPANSFYELDYEKQPNDPVPISGDDSEDESMDNTRFEGDTYTGLPIQQPPPLLQVGRIIELLTDESVVEAEVFGSTVTFDTGAPVDVAKVKVLLQDGRTVTAYIRQFTKENGADVYPLESRVLIQFNDITKDYEVMPLSYNDPNGTKARE